MVDCSEKRPFICERPASRLQTRNLQEKVPAELTNDLSQSLTIFKRDLDDELRDTSAKLDTQRRDLQTIIPSIPINVDRIPLARVIQAINALTSGISSLIGPAGCTNLKTKHDLVLNRIETVIQMESALPTYLSGIQDIAAVQHFAKKLKRRHLEIQSSICSICSVC